MKTVNPTYETSDLNLAAYLQTNGVDLVNVSMADKRRAVFIFRDNPNRQQLVISFFSHKTTVEPLTYVAAMRQLKSFAMELKGSNAMGASK